MAARQPCININRFYLWLYSSSHSNLSTSFSDRLRSTLAVIDASSPVKTQHAPSGSVGGTRYAAAVSSAPAVCGANSSSQATTYVIAPVASSALTTAPSLRVPLHQHQLQHSASALAAALASTSILRLLQQFQHRNFAFVAVSVSVSAFDKHVCISLSDGERLAPVRQSSI